MKHTKSSLVQMILLLAATILKFTLKKMILISLLDKLKDCDIEYVHPVKEHSWGQRVVRFYDPDKHIIEVGENIKGSMQAFLNSGMTPEQVAERMDVPMKFINACIR